MAKKSYQQLQQELTFDELMRCLDTHFQEFADHRASHTRYRLPEVLKSAFAMFSLKSPSLLDFKKQTHPEQSNLRSIYRLQGAIPCDNQMRGILDPLDPTPLRALYAALVDRLRRAGVVRQYQYWQNFVIVSVAGVEHFSSPTVPCGGCTTRTHRNGVISYQHAALLAVMLHPDYREVFPLAFEPIVCQDGAKKNDCQRNANKRLGAALSERYPDLPILLVEDALHATAPHLRQITSYGWRDVVNIKPDSHTSRFKQFAGRQASGPVTELRRTDSAGVQPYFAWTNGLCLGERTVDVKVNVLWYEQIQPDGTLTRWTWITNWPLTQRTVEKVMRAGRGRWKIENETFNPLKNQGYHFTHNYGHGEQSLATVLALLMVLAFLVDQIQQR